ncbi:phosphate ABC transporter permease subunit PstC [Salipiger sp.]|uniref:phosphate ABC transporter permease subunit PstC n=1 Tax=Salipiger sp. TaxID=2078585 RepID=UPI003A97191B
MPAVWLFLIVLALGLVGLIVGRALALRDAGGDIRQLHSRPGYYGAHVMLWTVLPAVALMAVWLVVQPMVIKAQVASMVPDAAFSDSGALSLIMSDVRRVADGLDIAVERGVMTPEQADEMRTGFTDVRARLGEVGVALGSNVESYVLKAAQAYRKMSNYGGWILTALTLGAAVGGFALSLRGIDKDFRSRNSVERVTLWVLMLAASVAVLTTVGIFLALLSNTVEFFRIYPWTEYFFGTTWQPRSGGGAEQPLGLIPLLWGTLYISFIALAVAVPIGLFAAIYLSEYASPRVRGLVKPALEILAGIPSIVYGLFALLTVGPMLLSVFGPNGGLGIMQGASSVMTAGLVMGIMLIPFVSSLSDDIINAVPQSLRDGSYGLGATNSETIKQVILPAALPGIVGAIILAASRAIGETMLVVFGAGAAGRLSMNPFEAMTTVTAKIVSQLTGDADFTQPEVLVAYALGTTLFVVTLGLNLLAQRIVAKYREQYT